MVILFIDRWLIKLSLFITFLFYSQYLIIFGMNNKDVLIHLLNDVSHIFNDILSLDYSTHIVEYQRELHTDIISTESKTDSLQNVSIEEITSSNRNNSIVTEVSEGSIISDNNSIATTNNDNITELTDSYNTPSTNELVVAPSNETIVGTNEVKNDHIKENGVNGRIFSDLWGSISPYLTIDSIIKGLQIGGKGAYDGTVGVMLSIDSRVTETLPPDTWGGKSYSQLKNSMSGYVKYSVLVLAYNGIANPIWLYLFPGTGNLLGNICAGSYNIIARMFGLWRFEGPAHVDLPEGPINNLLQLGYNQFIGNPLRGAELGDNGLAVNLRAPNVGLLFWTGIISNIIIPLAPVTGALSLAIMWTGSVVVNVNPDILLGLGGILPSMITAISHIPENIIKIPVYIIKFPLSILGGLKPRPLIDYNSQSLLMWKNRYDPSSPETWSCDHGVVSLVKKDIDVNNISFNSSMISNVIKDMRENNIAF